MRPISSFFVALIALTALAACGTKTSLSLPSPAQPASTATMPPAADNSNKAAPEPRQ